MKCKKIEWKKFVDSKFVKTCDELLISMEKRQKFVCSRIKKSPNLL